MRKSLNWMLNVKEKNETETGKKKKKKKKYHESVNLYSNIVPFQTFL
jgi:hypothetical protein